MFCAKISQSANGPLLTMEGRLVGDWAKQARSLVTETSLANTLIVDLTEVTYVDSVGEQVLGWLGSLGAAFVANTTYAACVCQRLHLPRQAEPGDPSENCRRRRADAQSTSHTPGGVNFPPR